MRADILHRKLLHSRRHRFSTEGAHFECRHVVARHFLLARGIGHNGFQEGGTRLEQRDLVALNNGGETTCMREQGRAFGNDGGHAKC